MLGVVMKRAIRGRCIFQFSPVSPVPNPRRKKHAASPPNILGGLRSNRAPSAFSLDHLPPINFALTLFCFLPTGRLFTPPYFLVDKQEGKMEESRRTHNFRFPAGSTHLMVGPSASGKTFRTARILRLKHLILENGEHIKNVVFCYAAWQKEYDLLKNENVVTQWFNKMPTNDDFIKLVEPFTDKGGSVVVIDDFMSAINKDMEEIVRVTSRHYNTTTFILFQSLFPPHKLARQISLNVKFLHIHKNPRENAQITFLARQLMPHAYKWIVDVYHEVTQQPYSCLLIDLTQERDECLRFRSNYLPGEFPMKLWVQKGTMCV